MAGRLAVYFKDEDAVRAANCRESLPVDLFYATDKLETAQVICGHNSNLKGFNQGQATTSYAQHYQNKLIVVYSGSGNPKLSTTDQLSKKVLKLVRTIHRGHGSITLDEWREIHQLIDHNRFTSPTLAESSTTCLSTLALLCQGYLITYATPHTTLDDSVVQTALNLMGWTNLLDRALIQNINFEALHSYQSCVNQSIWWIDCFEPDQISVSLKSGQLNIQGDIAREWGGSKVDTSKIALLLQAIYIDGNLTTQIVAQAYCEIFQRFNASPLECSFDAFLEKPYLPEVVLLLGKGSLTKALSQTLNLLGIECLQYTAIPNNVEALDDFRNEIITANLAITISDNITEIGRQVRHLRNDCYWDNTFVAITKNITEKESLLHYNLFGESTDKLVYGQVAGHTALTQPLRLRDLLVTPSTVNPLSIEQWLNLAQHSKLYLLKNQVHEINKHLIEEATPSSIKLLNEILVQMSQISWATLVDHDQELPTIRKLLEMQSIDTTISIQDCLQLISAIQKVFIFAIGNT
ncbi:hypothetical protein NIES2107_73030 (plasmid) [Nostoc carneum NIES-2107]|nr:hypothetical protein NIES2107_73030 [Nostoc carneum NIES-2107]